MELFREKLAELELDWLLKVSGKFGFDRLILFFIKNFAFLLKMTLRFGHLKKSHYLSPLICTDIKINSIEMFSIY